MGKLKKKKKVTEVHPKETGFFIYGMTLSRALYLIPRSDLAPRC